MYNQQYYNDINNKSNSYLNNYTPNDYSYGGNCGFQNESKIYVGIKESARRCIPDEDLRKEIKAPADNNLKPILPGYYVKPQRQDLIKTYKVYDIVEARYNGFGIYYPGEIIKVNANGTYDIQYNDGDRELNVQEELIRPLNSQTISYQPVPDTEDLLPISYSMYDIIESKTLDGVWLKGEISRINADGTYNVQFDSGESERNVPMSRIRLHNRRVKFSQSTDSYPPLKFLLYDRIEGRFGGKDKWYAGEICKINDNGTYNIQYDDGDIEYDVTSEYIRLVNNSNRDWSTSKSSYSLYDRIECRYRGREKWFLGEISSVNKDGTYNIKYDEGTTEVNVRKELIRPQVYKELSEATQLVVEPEIYGIYDRIEARFCRREVYYPGEIKESSGNNTYTVLYDDGDIEYNVESKYIRRPTPKLEIGKRVRIIVAETTYNGKIISCDQGLYINNLFSLDMMSNLIT